MIHAPEVHVVEVSGGRDRAKKACDALTPHGYYGIEHQVVGSISNWITGHIKGGQDR
jgi:hypothetical protein